MSAPRPPDVAAPRWALGTAVAAFGLVAVLAGAVLAGAGPLLRVDRAVSAALYAGDDRGPALGALLQVATAPGLSVVRVLVFLPVLGWLLVRRRWWTAGWVAAAVLLVAPLTGLLKELVGRLRPQYAGGGAEYTSLAFPSGHASGVAALVTTALLLAWPALGPRARRWWLAAGLALAVLVGLTRIWLGVHWLSDVVGGEALGLGWTLLVAGVASRRQAPAPRAEVAR
ncbi:phosphatase PAP2 family protein [Modestobacter sp. URMC 112]